MYHFTGYLYLPLVSLLCWGKIHPYFQVWFQLLAMQHDGPWKAIITALQLFYVEAPNQAELTQLLRCMNSEQWQSKSSKGHLCVEEKVSWMVSKTGVSGSGLGTVIRVRHSPVVAQWPLSDDTAPAGQPASGFGSRVKLEARAQCRHNHNRVPK